MSKIGGFTWNGSANNQYKYVSTKVVASGATALVVSLEDLNVTLSAGEVNVSAFQNTSATPKDAFVFNANEDLSGVSEFYQGVGGLDVTADRFRALHISTDDSAMPATPLFLPVGGEFRAAATTYADGDATVLQTDVNGLLKVSSANTEYAEDAGHTSGDKGNFVLGIRTDTLGTAANIAGADAEYMGLQMNAKGSLYVDLSSVLGANMSVTNGAFTQITDNTTVVGVISGTTALKTDTSSVAGTATNVNGGNRDAGTQTITLADDDPAVASLAIMDDWDAVHSSAVSSDGPQVMSEAADFDGSALPNAVSEGEAVRPKASLQGIQYSMLTGEDGSSTPVIDHSAVITAGLGVATVMQGMEAADFDGSALPNVVAEGDAVRPKASLQGVPYVMVVSEDGSSRPAYDSSTDSFKQFEVSPIWNQHLEETILDVSSDTATNTLYVDMDGYSGLNIQLVITGDVTVTIEASAQDDGTAAASVTYIDVTNDVFGSATFTASAFLFDDAKVLGGAKFIKIIAVTASSDAVRINIKKVY